MKIQSINPNNNSVAGELEASSDREIQEAVVLAHKAKQMWKHTPIADRVQMLTRAKELFKQHEEDIAQLITQEIGTPIVECRDEVAWDWGYFDWFLQNAEKILAPQVTYQDDSSTHEIWYEPYGVVAAITPWNLPFDMFIWAVIPNLLAGNVVIHKASEECVLAGKLFADIMEQVGLPPGVFQAIHGDEYQGKQLLDQNIDMIWFTGSYAVGHALYKQAADKFIKVILELGGSNPAIIFQDADIDNLLKNVMFKRFSFCGQTCDALKRLIMHESIYEEVVSKLSASMGKLIVGNPQNPTTQIGPLVSHKQLELIQAQLGDALSKGAVILYRGDMVDVDRKGAYFAPTLIGNITPDMRVWKEEVFGPLLPIMKFSTDEEAIQLANNTMYGLGSQIFTTDKERAMEVAKRLEAGNVDINGVGHFKPCNPFGGYKKSGVGREHGEIGFRELCNVKVVVKNK